MAYLIRVYDSAGSLLREERSSTPAYSYTYQKNLEDGGPRRTVELRVVNVDEQGNESDTPATIEVNNPAPVQAILTSPILVATLRGFLLAYGVVDPSDSNYDSDFAGVVVAASTTNPPSTTNDIVYTGDGRSIPLDFAPGVPVYVRYAPYDQFGTSGLNWSSTASVTPLKAVNTDINDVDPEVVNPGTMNEVHVDTSTGATGQRVELTTGANGETQFWGDRGDGTIEELCTIGISTVGGDAVIGRFGSDYADKIAVYGKNSSNFSTASFTNGKVAGGTALSASGSGSRTARFTSIQAGSYALELISYSFSGGAGGLISYGSNTANYSNGVKGYGAFNPSYRGYGIWGSGSTGLNGVGGRFMPGDIVSGTWGSNSAHLLLDPRGSVKPTHSAAKGSVWMDTFGSLWVNYNGTTGWKLLGTALLHSSSFSAVANKQIDSVFTADFKKYKVVVSGLTQATAGKMRMRLAKLGVLTTASYYWRTTDQTTLNATYAEARASSDTHAVLQTNASTASDRIEMVIEITNPYSSTDYPTIVSNLYTQGSTDLVHARGFSTNKAALADQFDGIYIDCDAGNISGMIEIFGVE